MRYIKNNATFNKNKHNAMIFTAFSTTTYKF